MVTNRFGRFFLVLSLVGLLPVAVLADEVVHFTNGAEMTVKTHNVENDKSMVRLDLGNNSYIAFPMSMVEKIVSAGHDVFLNPGFHPSNQAIAGGVPDTTVRGIPGSSNPGPQPDGKGHAGVMLGEAADSVGSNAPMGALTNDTMANSRRRFNPAHQMPPGSTPQVIMPPGLAQPARGPVQLSVIGAPHATELQVPAPAPPPPPPVTTPAPETPPADDPPPEDPPDNP
jgi:hypothetical protein